MSLEFASRNLDELRAEQKAVQADKFQGRMLSEYNNYIFPGQNWHTPQGSEVADFIRPYSTDGNRVSLEGVLDGLHAINNDQPVHWVDMGGGRALTMRQLSTMSRFAHKLTMTNVDLFDYNLDGLTDEEMTHLESAYPGITAESAKPHLVLDTVETSVLLDPPDVITSIESMQYLNNPLGAITNWYNQLNDNGFMMIANDSPWSNWIRYKEGESVYEYETMPMNHILQQLGAAGIQHAATAEVDYENGYRPKLDIANVRSFIVQKQPGTQMNLMADVAKVWTNPWNYKAVYYEKPADDSIIEVVSTN